MIVDKDSVRLVTFIPVVHYNPQVLYHDSILQESVTSRRPPQRMSFKFTQEFRNAVPLNDQGRRCCQNTYKSGILYINKTLSGYSFQW